MKNRSLKYALWVVVLAVGTVYSAEALLYDTFADGSRGETALPMESAVWVSHPDAVTPGAGSLAFAQGTSSTKMWTYFREDGNPVSIGVGEQLIATIKFSPRGALYSGTSRNFRFGLFHDPTDGQLLQDANSDHGNGRWYDSAGYAVQLSISPDSTSATVSVGKRTDLTGTATLLGSTSAYVWSNGTDKVINAAVNTPYVLALKLERLSADEMKVTFTFSGEEGVIAAHTLVDNGLGALPIHTVFDQLFFRMNSAAGTADILDYHSIKVEYVAEYKGPPVGIPHTIAATESCRTEGGSYVDSNRHDNSKLSVRNSNNGNKSWIKFPFDDLDPNTLKAAALTVVFVDPEGDTVNVDVSAANDNCLDNINWTQTNLTWNNAPGNLTTDLGLLDPLKTTLLGTISATDPPIGQPVEIDVLSAMKTDTDGIVQFVLHNSSVLMNFGTHDHAIAAYRPVLTLLEAPAGADYPTPYPGQTVETTQPSLSWTNPEPNFPGTSIYCDVYLGTEPNRPQMDKVSLDADASSVAIHTGNFHAFGSLVNNVTYYWVVDCYDSSTGPDPIAGLMWSFYTDNNHAPEVDAGAGQTVWLGMSGIAGEETAVLHGVTSDDGRPGPYTVEWTQTPTGAPTAAIADSDQDEATVTFHERGSYEFVLTADDGDKTTSDTVTIDVGDDACDAWHLSSGTAYDAGDANRDCLVNLEDFALLLSTNWLNCTDTLTDCQ